MTLRTAAEIRAIRAKGVKESTVEDYFCEQAKRYDCRQRKLTQYYAEDGWPDRLLVWNDGKGTTDFAELKRPKGGKLEPRQKTIATDLLRRGAVVAILPTKEAVDQFFETRAKQLGVKPLMPDKKRRHKATLSAAEINAMYKGMD